MQRLHMINLYYDMLTICGPVPNGIKPWEYGVTKGHYKNIPYKLTNHHSSALQPLTIFYNSMLYLKTEVTLYTGDNFANNLFYPIEISMSAIEDVVKLIPSKTLENIKINKLKLLLLYQDEGASLFEMSNFKKIVDQFIQYGIQQQNIHIVLSDLHNAWQDLFGDCKVFHLDWWQFKHQVTCKSRLSTTQEDNLKWISLRNYDTPLCNIGRKRENFDLDKWTNPNKIFLSFNGNRRVHRAGFLSELMTRNLMDHGYISYNVYNGLNFIYDDIDSRIVDSDANPVYIERKRKAINWLNNNNLLLDQNKTGLETDDRNYDSYYFYNTYFSVVTETFSPWENTNYPKESDILWFTEKTWKPIAIGHPFMLLGSIGTMKYLRSEGYQTYDMLFDEAYDKEINLIKRINMIADNIQRIVDMPKNEIDSIIKDIKPILNSNKELFYNKTHSDLISNLFKEMTNE